MPPTVPTDSSSDAGLMQRVAAADEGALAMLYDRYGSLVYTLARAILRRDQDAEEVTEDVFVHLWTAPERFDEARGALGSYLTTIARTRALDRVRASGRRDAAYERASAGLGGELASPISQTPPTDHRAERSEQRDRISRALEALNPDQRRAIELAYFEGLSQSEVAERLDEPLGTVKTRIRDGMTKLRDTFIATGAAGR